MMLLAILFFPLALSAQTLSGVVDVHVHADPDSRPRSIDAVDLAKLAQARGMRALLFKNHNESTAALAYLVRKTVPGIEVFGGIVLNRAVGGVNPAAVEQMVAVKGGWGRVVWMPTAEAENQVRYEKANRPFVPVTLNGQLRPEVNEVLALVAKYKLTLATGHSAPEESLLLIREARRLGVERIVVTHALSRSVNMSVAQMQAAAKLGAYIELVYHARPVNTDNPPLTIQEYEAAIRAVGPEHCILSSDLGQVGNPLHPDGLAAFFRALREKGFTEADIDRMSKRNPATVLGLP
ncbi:MAG: hypothetical protein A3H28_08185 [Acidobacteria bacterium RIFCSPLOWO2_02_FULL_61_28]|nr:MAG: hypothetical protein A3H28_08185 [Acidobacteria bacterium RIFCSPLOWO2_02_FULL_61_28]